MTEVPETQREAFKAIKGDGKLGLKQQTVYNLICKGPITNDGIARTLGWPINSVTGRVRELVQARKVENSGEVRVNPDTNRPAVLWQKWTGDKNQLPLFEEGL